MSCPSRTWTPNREKMVRLDICSARRSIHYRTHPLPRPYPVVLNVLTHLSLGIECASQNVASISPSLRGSHHHRRWADLPAPGQGSSWWPVHRVQTQHCGSHDERTSGAKGASTRVWGNRFSLYPKYAIDFLFENWIQNVIRFLFFCPLTESPKSSAAGRLFNRSNEGKQKEESLQEYCSM